jgi:hypothetical protein
MHRRLLAIGLWGIILANAPRAVAEGLDKPPGDLLHAPPSLAGWSGTIDVQVHAMRRDFDRFVRHERDTGGVAAMPSIVRVGGGELRLDWSRCPRELWYRFSRFGARVTSPEDVIHLRGSLGYQPVQDDDGDSAATHELVVMVESLSESGRRSWLWKVSPMAPERVLNTSASLGESTESMFLWAGSVGVDLPVSLESFLSEDQHHGRGCPEFAPVGHGRFRLDWSRCRAEQRISCVSLYQMGRMGLSFRQFGNCGEAFRLRGALEFRPLEQDPSDEIEASGLRTEPVIVVESAVASGSSCWNRFAVTPDDLFAEHTRLRKAVWQCSSGEAGE